jgi:hypothetical protein
MLITEQDISPESYQETKDLWWRRLFGSEPPKEKELARPGAKSASQTPAPPKERIKGSEQNKPGSAATKSTGGKIEIGERNQSRTS